MGLNLDHPHVKTGDPGGALIDWRFDGATDENTSRGRLYVAQGLVVPGEVELYRDRDLGPADLVAAGPDAAVIPGFVVLTERNGSGLSATIYRTSGTINGTGTPERPGMEIRVWLCSEEDLRENEDALDGLFISGEVRANVALRKTVREFLTRMAADYPPPPCSVNPILYTSPIVEGGRRGAVEWTAECFWTLNQRGQWELTGLQNPEDYREWAINQTLAFLYYRKSRAGNPNDPWFSRWQATTMEADRQWSLVKPWLDWDRDTQPDRQPRVRNVRVRRG